MTKERPKKLELRDVAVMLPVGVACAFCVAVAHFFGELIVTGTTGLVRFLTFSDYVNLAVPTVSLLLVATLVALVCIGTLAPRMIETFVRVAKYGMGSREGRSEPTAKDIWRMGIVFAIIVAAGAIIVLAGAASLSAMLLLALLIVLLVTLVALVSHVGRPHLSDKALGASTSFLFLLIVGGFTGYLDGLEVPRCGYKIAINNKESVAPLRFYSIERGLALVWPGKFDLIAWENAKMLHADDGCHKTS